MKSRNGKSRLLSALLPAIVCVLLSAASGQENDGAEVLLQRAVHQELVDGDLEDAIELYQKTIDDHNGHRPLAAKALVHMGQC